MSDNFYAEAFIYTEIQICSTNGMLSFKVFASILLAKVDNVVGGLHKFDLNINLLLVTNVATQLGGSEYKLCFR